MSKLRRIRIGVYGRFQVDVIRQHGAWNAFRLGTDGKRSLLYELALEDTASAEEIVHAIEAAFHELGGPGREILVLDLLMA